VGRCVAETEFERPFHADLKVILELVPVPGRQSPRMDDGRIDITIADRKNVVVPNATVILVKPERVALDQ
jgi:hypothetical protein